MSLENNILSIQLLDKTWQIRCPEEKMPDLQKCARYLDNKMRDIALVGKTMSNERILVMAAINVIYDLLLQQGQKDIYIDSLSSRIRELQNKLQQDIPFTEKNEV